MISKYRAPGLGNRNGHLGRYDANIKANELCQIASFDHHVLHQIQCSLEALRQASKIRGRQSSNRLHELRPVECRHLMAEGDTCGRQTASPCRKRYRCGTCAAWLRDVDTGTMITDRHAGVRLNPSWETTMTGRHPCCSDPDRGRKSAHTTSPRLIGEIFPVLGFSDVSAKLSRDRHQDLRPCSLARWRTSRCPPRAGSGDVLRANG
jgi:hypothetical protein